MAMTAVRSVGRGEVRRDTREARYLRRADAFEESGETEKAVSHLRKLVALIPESTRGYLRLAAILRRERRPAEALEVLRKAVTQSPRCIASREALAETSLENGCWEEAILQGRALLLLSPRSLFARDVLSAAYLQRGQFDQALRITDEMIRIDPNDPSHHFKRGVLQQQKGLIGPAVASFCRVLEMDPDPEVAEETRTALEMLDGYQIRQILALAAEDIPFRLRLLRDAREAVTLKGFLLSEAGLAALSRVPFDELCEAPLGWRQYLYQ